MNERKLLYFWLVFIVIFFLIFYLNKKDNKHDNLEELNNSKNLHYFYFYINETNESLESGEIFFDNYYFGNLSYGKINLTKIDQLPQNITIKGIHKNIEFEFEYSFPEYYLEYQTVDFLVSEKDLERYKIYNNYKKVDQYRTTRSIHWTKMPLTYYINTTDEYEELKEQKIENFKDAIKRLTEVIPSIKLVEIDSQENADIIFAISLPREFWEVNDYYNEEDSGLSGLMIPEDIGNIRLNAYVFDFPMNRCRDGDTALHELLHAFGVDHSEYDYGDIMSPNSARCDGYKKISEEIIKNLTAIYGI